MSLVQRCMRSPMLMTYALGMYGTVAQSSPFGSTCPPNKINENKKQVANGNNQKQHVLTCVGGRTSRDMYRWLQLHTGHGCPRASKSVLCRDTLCSCEASRNETFKKKEQHKQRACKHNAWVCMCALRIYMSERVRASGGTVCVRDSVLACSPPGASSGRRMVSVP